MAMAAAERVFSPDGRSALTGSRDGTLLLWLATEWRKQAPPPAAATASHDRRPADR